MKYFFLLLIFIFTSCKKNVDEEKMAYLKTELQKQFPANEKIVSLKLLNADSLSESQIYSIAWDNVESNLKKLIAKQDKLGNYMLKNMTAKNKDSFELAFRSIQDSMYYYQKLGDKIFKKKPDSLRIEYVEYTVISQVKDVLNNKIKIDSFLIYSPKNKIKTIIPSGDLINHINHVKFRNEL